jgi:hypothetical protein
MQVTNKKGSYTIVPQNSSVTTSSAATSSGSSSASAVTYTVKELSGVPIDSTAVSGVVELGYSLGASKNVGTVTDLSVYGLETPQATVKVTFKDNTTYNYKIGNASASDTASYYMCAENSKNVYDVSINSSMLEDKLAFVKKSILAITPDASASSDSANSGSTANDFTQIMLSGTNFPKSVTIEKGKDNNYAITAPSRLDLDSTPFSNVTTALATLSATEVAAIQPDAAALKKYGLDNPSAVASFTVNKKSYKVLAGAKSSSNRYVMLDGVNVVYLVTNDSVTAWADTNLFKLRDKFVCIPAISNVASMTVTSGSDVNTFNISRTKDTAASSGSTTAYKYEVTGNGGKKLTYDQNFKNYYQAVIQTTLLEDSNKKPTGTPAVTIAYKLYDGTSKTVEYYSTADRRYTAVVNGVVSGLVKSADVEAIVTNTKTMQNNGLIAVS